MKLQNLRYCNGYVGVDAPPNAFQKASKLILAVLAPWAYARFVDADEELLALPQEDGDSPLDVFRRSAAPRIRDLKKYWGLFRLFNAVAFLRHGRYATLVDRLLAIRLVEDRPDASRSISFDIMNQQLLLNGFTELAATVVPMIDFGGIYRKFRWLRRKAALLLKFLLLLLKKLREKYKTGNSEEGQWTDGNEGENGTDDAANKGQLGPCCECGKDPPTMPHQASCRHVFCYVCIKSALVHDEDYCCPECGAVVAAEDGSVSVARCQ